MRDLCVLKCAFPLCHVRIDLKEILAALRASYFSTIAVLLNVGLSLKLNSTPKVTLAGKVDN